MSANPPSRAAAGVVFEPARALLRLLRGSPYPALLQDARYRIVDCNDAFAALAGCPPAALAGRDPIEWLPAEDRAGHWLVRGELDQAFARGQPPPPVRGRLLDAAGRERWFAASAHNAAPAGAPPLLLTLLQDLTPEHFARVEAERVQDELLQWIELAPIGMLVFDDTGLVLRSNPAFEALVGTVPVMLADAGDELQALLGWRDGALSPELVAGAASLSVQAAVRLPDGRQRRLGARLACRHGEGGSRRVMALVDDRSAEEERDRAQAEIGMLMDTASIGVATFDPGRGWLLPPRAGTAARGGVLQGIGRELVEPASRDEYERLQRALRRGERHEGRYAVRHPELGERWLLTRIEPASPGAGGSAVSVVTLDVTEQERAQRRNEQLLRELTTILDGSTAGIAYLRGSLLVRCNRRFERMLGLAPGAAAGASFAELLRRIPDGALRAREAAAALDAGRPYETELALGPAGRGGGPWYSLSVRRAEPAASELEAVAVLTDVSRLKTQQVALEQLARERELMFDLSEVGIVYQRGARIERANQAMASLTGYANPELTTLDVALLYPDARDCVEFEARIAAALRSEARFAGERRLRRRDGSLVWVQVSVRPADAEAPDAGVICSFVDIDERRRARESLALQAERTRAVLDSVLVGIVTVSARGIEWMNRSARRMFGAELAELVGEPIWIVATSEPDHPLRRDDWLETLQEGQAETFECRLEARDGRKFWVVGNAVVTGRESASRQLTFALLDIESRRQAEVSIAQAQASLQRVIETAPLAIALFDAQSRRVLHSNQAAASFFGRAAGELRGGTPRELASPAKAQALERWLDEAAGRVDSGEAGRHELREEAHERSDPRVWDARVVALGSGGETQLLLVASDVTEQRAAEQARLQAAIAQRELLVREVHHRIKNNLQGVAGLLQQNAARHPEVAQMLTEAVGQVQAIAQVYGLQVGAGGPLQVAGVLQAIAQSVQRTFGRPIEVDVAPAAGFVLPEAEAIPIALTVNELLTNAIKHGGAEGARCAARPGDDGGVVIAVVNPGALPAGFALARVPGGVSGLGLVRALLPRRSASFALEQRGAEVEATVVLKPPSVRAGDAALAG